MDTADWFVAGIAGALLVNLGRGTGLPRCPPPSRAGGPLDAEGPAGIATTLRDAPRLRGWSRDGKNEPVRSSGIASSSSPAVVATVLRRLPLRRLVRSGVRDAALRADHGGGPKPRPGPRDPARSRRRKTPVQQGPGRPGLPGSAWTRPTGNWASCEHLQVNPDPRTGLPRRPPPHGPADPLDAQGPAGITITLKDAPERAPDSTRTRT